MTNAAINNNNFFISTTPHKNQNIRALRRKSEVSKLYQNIFKKKNSNNVHDHK